MAADGHSNLQQILQNVLDQVHQALRVTVSAPINVILADPLPVSFSGGTQHVEIDAQSDSVAIGDASTGNSAQVVGNKLQTSSAPIPSSDWQPKTVTVTASPQQLTFSGLSQVTSISIVAFGTNTDAILVAKTSGASISNSYYLFAGSALNIPISAGAAVWLVSNSGSQQLTAAAVN